MALPGNVSVGTVTGTFLTSNGEPAHGTVKFTAEAPYVLDAAADTILVSLAHTVELDEDGAFTVDLVATDDADLLPIDFTYRVRPYVIGLNMPPFSIEVPGGSDQDLADIAPASGSGGTLPDGPLDPEVADLVPGPSLTHDALVELIEETAPEGGGAVDSVNGETGVVVLDKTDIGLGNVDNTSDASKPVSTLTQTALDGKSATGHAHAASDVTSGTLAVARIGSGTAAAGKYVDGGTGAWTTLPTDADEFGAYPVGELGLVGASVSPDTAQGTGSGASAYITRIWVPAGAVITRVGVYVASTTAVGTTECSYAVYSDSGTFLAKSTSDNTLFSSTGWRFADLTAPIAADTVGRWVRAGWNPGLASGSFTVAFKIGSPDW